jgi:small GTP-binding protein
MKFNPEMNDSLSFKEDISESDLSALNYSYTKRKILILGGQEVGKTSIIKRYKNNLYLDEYEPTIQQISKKVFNFNDAYIYLEIMDFEGQTEYTIFSPNKFSFGYNGYILVYDVKSSKSFELIKFIYEQINILSGNISKILVGTKCDKDLESNTYMKQVSTEEGKNFAEKIHCPFLEVSSKDNINIEEIFRLLIIEINKTESGVNLTQIKFVKIFQFFLHHPKLMIYCFYINLLILIILSVIIFYVGIYKDFSLKKEDSDYYFFGIGFPYIILGIWGILINVGGIVGMRNKDIFLLKLNSLGLIYACIFSLFSIGKISLINKLQDLTSDKIMLNIYFFLIIIVPSIFGIILSSIYKVLYQKDLKSYMA